MSGLVERVREAPRSTKIAGAIAVVAVAALAVFALTGRSEPPPAPAPVVQQVEAPTASPPGAVAGETPISPTATAPPPAPTSQPLAVEDNSVVLRGSDFYIDSDKGRKVIELTDAQSFVEYLAASGAIDQKELERYEQEQVLQLTIDELANNMFELVQSQGYDDLKERFGLEKEDVKYLVGFTEDSEPVVAEAIATPTKVPVPAAAPTRVSEEVVIKPSSNNAYASFGYDNGAGLVYVSFRNAGVLLDYLHKEGVLTSAQKRSVVSGDPIAVSGDKVSVAIYKLLGSVDICIILGICQQLTYLQSNGHGCWSSFVASQTCMSDRRPTVSGSSRLSCG